MEFENLNKDYEINAFAQDPISLKKRTDYASALMEDMMAQPYLQNLQQNLQKSFPRK